MQILRNSRDEPLTEVQQIMDKNNRDTFLYICTERTWLIDISKSAFRLSVHTIKTTGTDLPPWTRFC